MQRVQETYATCATPLQRNGSEGFSAFQQKGVAPPYPLSSDQAGGQNP